MAKVFDKPYKFYLDDKINELDENSFLLSCKDVNLIKSKAKLILPFPSIVIDDLSYFYWLPMPSGQSLDMELKNENKAAYFDIDDTLIVSKESKDTITVENYGRMETHYINQKNIDLIKEYKNKNYTIVLWSQSGGLWAEKVAKALNIDELVSFYLSKPSKIISDISWESLIKNLPEIDYYE